MSLSFQDMYEISKANDDEYDGEFFMCVKTTGIYCIPSCKARIPNYENVEFVSTKKQASAKGFRGCKRCKSELYPFTEPEWFKITKEFISDNIYKKLLEQDLEKIAGVNISTVRRYFKAELGLTPSIYHRKLQLQSAHQRIENGEDYRDILFEYGYDSVSGFRTAFQKEFGYNVGEVNGK